jgi:hypothetical protein
VARRVLGLGFSSASDHQQNGSNIAESLGMKETNGALVPEPQAESPAAKAGVLSGDVITAVNGQAIKNARGLARQIGAGAWGPCVETERSCAYAAHSNRAAWIARRRMGWLAKPRRGAVMWIGSCLFYLAAVLAVGPLVRAQNAAIL